jgi:hypothetical protein
MYYKIYNEALQEHSGSFISRDGTFREVMWKGRAADHERGGTPKKTRAAGYIPQLCG